MRVVTVNLLGGRGLPSDFERFLSEWDPDVVCAQEVGHDAGRVLERRFDHGLVRPAFSAMGRALVSRFPITVDRVDLPFRSGLATTFPPESPLSGVRLLSIHLANPIDPFSGVPIRRKQLDSLEPLISGTNPMLLVGDFNATPAWPAYKRLRRCMDDLVTDHAARVGRAPQRTWAKRPGGRALLRIDHILGRHVVAKDVAVDRLAGVDHLPVIADLVR